MKESTHIDMTQAALDAIEWPGDIKRAARAARYPDEVRAVEVEGLGAHVMGRNLASLTHFVVPCGNDKFCGYNWKLDGSVPHLDLTRRVVCPNPSAWGFPVIESFKLKEPLMELVRDLTVPGHVATIEADRITYPAASIMADWCFQLYDIWALDGQSGRKQEALDLLCGWMMHLGVQDPAVPHHAVGVLLAGHSAFESDVDELWHRMKATGEAAAVLYGLKTADNCPDNLTVRGLAEDLATEASVTLRKLRLSRLWPPSWKKLVRECVMRGLTGSVRLGKLLIRVARSGGR